jgi:CRISPR-associated endonuclease Cas2
MPRPKNIELSLAERLCKLKKAQINAVENLDLSNLELQSLPERITKILNIIKQNPIKRTDMPFLVMYDISNTKIRTTISKYLEDKGCIRVQYSVFLCNGSKELQSKIKNDLQDVNDMYENNDSILVVPLQTDEARSMKIIGKNIGIESIIDPPNTLFF